MSIFIEVVAVNGRVPEGPQRIEFAESGGSIGRADDNTLRLVDPDRHISRYHARITHRLSRYFILDTGSSTPVILNSVPVGNGREAEIRPGDELRIAQYLLRVNAPPATSATQIARDALGGDNADPDTESRRRQAAAPASPGAWHDGDSATAMQTVPYEADARPTAGSVARQQDSALQRTGAQPVVQESPASGRTVAQPVLQESSASGRTGAQPVVQQSSASGRTGAQPPAREGSAPGSTSSLPVEVPGQFGQSPAAGRSPWGSEGAAGFDADALAGSLNPRAIVAALKGASSLDYDEDLVEELPHPVDAPESDPSLNAGDETRADLDMDVGATGDDATGQAASGLRQRVARARERTRGGSQPDLFGSGVSQSQHQREESLDSTGLAEAPTSAPAGAAPADALLRSLCDGAGVAGVTVQAGLTPRQAYALGAFVRAVAFGLREVLSSNMLEDDLPTGPDGSQTSSQNPIAAAASLEDAVAYLLGLEGPLSPAPLAAVQDAFDRLAAAQTVLPSAMRDAFHAAMARFNPQNVIARVGEGKGLDTLFSGGHKAKLWSAYAESYEQNAKEVEGDFRKALRWELTRIMEEVLAARRSIEGSDEQQG